MAYPEPILPLKGKKAVLFREKWEQFTVSKEERKRLAGISEKVRRKMQTQDK